MKRLLTILAFTSLIATANTDTLNLEVEPELGIAPIEFAEPERARDVLVLDLPDYNEDTIVKKIEVNKKYRQKNLKYKSQRIKKSM